MDSSPLDLPNDIDACHTLILRQEEDRRQQAETMAEQQETIDRLMAEVALLKRAFFGSRRERFVDHPQQGYLFDSTELNATESSPAPKPDDPETAAKPRRTSPGRGRRVFPAFLPRKSIHHTLREEEIPEALRTDPTAKRFFKKTSEQLEFGKSRPFFEKPGRSADSSRQRSYPVSISLWLQWIVSHRPRAPASLTGTIGLRVPRTPKPATRSGLAGFHHPGLRSV